MAIGSLILGIVIITTAIFALVIVISSRKIDFGDRLFDPQKSLRSQIRRKFGGRKLKMAKSKKSRSIDDILEEDSMDEELAYEEVSLSRPEATLGGATPAPHTAQAKPSPIPPSPPGSQYESEKEIKGEEEIMELKKLEKGEGEESEFLDVPVETTIKDSTSTFNRDLSIRLPKNMCLDEVFRLRITIKKSEEYSSELTLKELTLDEKEAKYYSLKVEKLGKKISEATIILSGITEAPLTIRPMAIGGVAHIAPSTRTVMFDSEAEETVIEFFITPTKWTEVMNVLRIEFEQNYKVIKTLEIPMKIYKRKFEALFGLNISGVQKYILLIYSAIGSVIGLYGTLANFVDFLPDLPF